MDWDDVRVFLALYAAKNLVDAGARLGLDRSTISRRIASLETRLDAQLFARTRDGLRPTATAERLHPYAERMDAEAVALARAAVSADADASVGLVRVATTEALATFLVTAGILELRRQHPRLVIELLTGNQHVDLARGEADLALRLAPLKHPSLRGRCVARTGIGLFAAPTYLRARGAPRSVSALDGHDVLMPSGDLARLPESRWLDARRSVTVVFRSSSMPALIAAAEAGLGLVPLPLGWGDSNRALERVLTLSQLPERSLWLVTTARRADAASPVRLVADAIAGVCRRAFQRAG